MKNQPIVFLSYGGSDLHIAIELNEELKAKNIETWLAEHDLIIGHRWKDEIREQIRRCDIVMVLITPRSKDSPWILFEIGAAWALGKQIFPVLQFVEPTELIYVLQGIQAFTAEGRSDFRKVAELVALKSMGKSITETLSSGQITPSTQCATHLHKTQEVEFSTQFAIDGAIPLWYPPNFKPYNDNRIQFVERSEEWHPVILHYPELSRALKKKELPRRKNWPKWVISKIEYPMIDQTEGKLRISLCHSNYEVETFLDAVIDQPIFPSGATLRGMYEVGDLNYRFDLPNMLTIKTVIWTENSRDSIPKILFVRRSNETDFFPKCWCLGVDEQMLGESLLNTEKGYNDSTFECDQTLFDTARRALLEELGVKSGELESIGLLSLFREYETYIVNALIIAQVKFAPGDLEKMLVAAKDKEEISDYEWRDLTLSTMSNLLINREYQPASRSKEPWKWHTDTRYRMLCTMFSIFGINKVQSMLEKQIQ